MQRFAMNIAYDGSSFWGWQIQPNQRTVQECLEKGLSEVAHEPIRVTGCGRTDRGVHAHSQVVHFDFPVAMTGEQIRAAVSTRTPYDIQIKEVLAVPDTFHARFDAVERGYTMHLAKQRTPFNRLYKTFVPYKYIRMDLIQACLPYFLGSHDFTSFSRPSPDILNFVCDVKSISFEEYEEEYILQISANRFLHNMVRRVLGCLLTISHKEMPPETVTKLIEMQNPSQMLLYTAPPQGLYLSKVVYPNEAIGKQETGFRVFS